jgi:site-specific DNA recombinase
MPADKTRVKIALNIGLSPANTTFRKRRLTKWMIRKLCRSFDSDSTKTTTRLLSGLKSKGIIDSALFLSQSAELSGKMRLLKAEKNKLMEQDEDDSAINDTQNLIDIIMDGPEKLNHFDDTLFYSIVDLIVVESNEQIKFRLTNGLDLSENIQRMVR